MEGYSKREIIHELLNLGLYGGIKRTARVPKDDNLKNKAWRVTNYAEPLLTIDPEEAICEVRRALPFKLPETEPPEW